MTTNKYIIEITPVQGYVCVSGSEEILHGVVDQLPQVHGNYSITRMGGRFYVRSSPPSGQSVEDHAHRLAVSVGARLPRIWQGVINV